MGIAVVEVVAVGTYRSKCGDLIRNCDIVTQVRGRQRRAVPLPFDFNIPNQALGVDAMVGHIPSNVGLRCFMPPLAKIPPD